MRNAAAGVPAPYLQADQDLDKWVRRARTCFRLYPKIQSLP
jgi:hypothetical protein